MARHYAPSIVFFDEVDAMVSTRGADAEHEASRRFKSELLSQIDGLTSCDAAPVPVVPTAAAALAALDSSPPMPPPPPVPRTVLVLATTNSPWDLDEAMRRRLEKRIYIPLPDAAGREAALRIHLDGVKLAGDVDLRDLAARAEGLSGADLRVLCREAAMLPMRRLAEVREPGAGAAPVRVYLPACDRPSLRPPSSSAPPLFSLSAFLATQGRTLAEIKAARDAGQLDAALCMADFEAALAKTPATVGAGEAKRYEEWDKKFGGQG